jgi:type II secretory pathway component PulC
VAQIKEVKQLFEELFGPIFLSERSRYAAMVAFVAVALLLMYALGSTLYGWYTDFKSPPVAAAEAHNDSATSEAQLITDLPKQHLFGQAAGDDAFLPVTSLQLRLTGIMKDPNEKRSVVIISEGGQPGKVFAIGDAILNGIVINSINDDGIVLEHSGRLEKLLLVRQPLTFQEAPKTLWETN